MYHDTVDPGKVFKRDAGAVWFTIKVNIQPDGKDPRTDLDCAKPIAVAVGAALLGAATGGYGAFALGASGSLGAAGTAGAAMSAISTTTATFVVGGAVAGAVTGFGGASVTTKVLGELISDNGLLEMSGQYAGYEWPARCNKMPEYEVTGGPAKQYNEKTKAWTVGARTTFTLKKVNDCGNDIMSKPYSKTAPSKIDWAAKLNK